MSYKDQIDFRLKISLVYLFLVLTIFFIVIIGTMVVLVLTGVLNLNDFAPVNNNKFTKLPQPKTALRIGYYSNPLF